MSSRALRRAQKELEERGQKEAPRPEDEEDESEEDILPATKPRPSMFALLGEASDDGDGDEEDEEAQNEQEKAKLESEPNMEPAQKPSKKTKKKRKKGKRKAKAAEQEAAPTSSKQVSGLDEIDIALRALNLTAQAGKENTAEPPTSTISEELQQLYSALSVDTQHLHAANEMRKLFGRAAVQGRDNDEPGRARRQARGRGQQGGAPGTQHLSSMALKRNIFVQGREEWPRATLGGLSMEVVEKRIDGTVEYRFVHNTTYQAVQREFEVCVAGMDPERMIQLLAYNRKYWLSLFTSVLL